jgi:hypothetical protein
MLKPNTAATVNKVDEYLQVLPAEIRKTLEQRSGRRLRQKERQKSN